MVVTMMAHIDYYIYIYLPGIKRLVILSGCLVAVGNVLSLGKE